jgi:hypothetical protein
MILLLTVVAQARRQAQIARVAADQKRHIIVNGWAVTTLRLSLTLMVTGSISPMPQMASILTSIPMGLLNVYPGQLLVLMTLGWP